ncbi:MAG TPA: hypothetical protein DIT25_03555 [Candidatus Moranbacteria bacterium]|nr:hypothetical protein [Candidatus Moranbacteria bacterium]
MKIGIDIRNIGKNRTGDEVVFFNLVKSLRITNSCEHANDIFYLFTDITDKNKLEEIGKSLGIEDREDFKIVPLETGNKFTWNFWTLPNHFRKNPIDIYLTQYITPFFVSKKIKIATIIHDVSFMAYGKYLRFSDLFFLRLLIPISLRRADKIIGVSKFTRDEILKYYDISEKKIGWIHNAVSDNFYREISVEEIKRVREKYSLPEKFILYIGTLQPRKNIPNLIRAYSDLPDEIKSAFKLVLAGGKGHNYDKRIDEEIERYSLENNVMMPGFVDEEDKPALFKASSLFCNPSFYEGFGITILEAMTLGIPTVASDIPPHREVAENSILLFSPENPAELSKKISSLLTDSALRAGLSEKETAQCQKFSWEKTAEKLRSFFRASNSAAD